MCVCYTCIAVNGSQKDYFMGEFLAPRFGSLVHHSWEGITEQSCSHDGRKYAETGLQPHCALHANH